MSNILGVVLPSTVYGRFMGSIILQFNQDGCNAMIISLTTGKLHRCTGQYVWSSSTLSKINGLAVKMDSQYFFI
jgi:hypothetical protein